MLGIFSKFFASNEKELQRLKILVDQVNEQEEEIQKLSDEKLREKFLALKRVVQEDDKSLSEILPQSFALTREAARRAIGERAFDVQVMAGIVLHQGRIAEQKTGEGKTLAATMPLSLSALSGKGCHLVTVNDYLARRDTEWMGPIYHKLGLSVGCINHEKSFLYDPAGGGDEVEVSEKEIMEGAKPARRSLGEGVEESLLGRGKFLREVSRREAYAADITYGTNNEFGFDYLRDNMVATLNEMVQREHYFAIVDEVDFLLIDESRTPLIISAPAEESNELYMRFARLLPQLPAEYYEVDEKSKAVNLTELGVAKMEKMLGVENLYQDFALAHHLEQAIKAYKLFQKDRDYIVKEGEVVIVDEFTGRLMPGRRYSEGLHQAIEAKEGVQIQKESKTLATITFQNYFRMYKKLAGMTGTAATEAEEFSKIYNLEVVVVPTNQPMIRQDFPDLIYKHQRAKFKAIIDEIEEKYQKGQPVLVGTTSVEKNELVDKLLSRRGIPHEVLNAKNHQREAEIIAKAGQKRAVTVATNLAGRGTDIKLGEGVKELGGLHVVGTERHEARRIDNQLRGRSGRQGDQGSSRFFVALDDDLMRIFGGERVASVMTRLNFPEDMPIEHGMISKAIENAQVKVEGYNFDIRKHLVEYDDVINKQREIIYAKRRRLLEGRDPEDFQGLKSQILEKVKVALQNMVLMSRKSETGEFDDEELKKDLESVLPAEEVKQIRIESEGRNEEEIVEFLMKIFHQAYDVREKQFTEEGMRHLEKAVMFSAIDRNWMEYIDALDDLRTGIGLRGYGQRDPLVEFKNEAFRMFEKLTANIDEEIVTRIFRVQLITPAQVAALQQMRARHQEVSAFQQPVEQQPVRPPSPAGQGQPLDRSGEVGKPKPQPVRKELKVGRNDPCPCGATKPDGTPIKYKHCHGRNV